MQKVHEAGDVGAFLITTPENDEYTIELQRPSAKRVARINLRRNDPEKAAKLSAMFKRISSPDKWPEEGIEIDFGQGEPEAVAKEGEDNVTA